METRNDIPNLLAMYIRNTREIYDITTWLQNCIIKKANKGIQPSIEHLANCSTMERLGLYLKSWVLPKLDELSK